MFNCRVCGCTYDKSRQCFCDTCSKHGCVPETDENELRYIRVGKVHVPKCRVCGCTHQDRASFINNPTLERVCFCDACKIDGCVAEPDQSIVTTYHYYINASTDTDKELLFAAVTNTTHTTAQTIELVKELIHRGVNVNSIITSLDGQTLTPLSCAIEQCNLDVAKLLASHGANVAFRNTNGESLLHIAAYNLSLDIVQWLISCYPSVYKPSSVLTSLEPLRARVHLQSSTKHIKRPGFLMLDISIVTIIDSFLPTWGECINMSRNDGLTPIIMLFYKKDTLNRDYCDEKGRANNQYQINLQNAETLEELFAVVPITNDRQKNLEYKLLQQNMQQVKILRELLAVLPIDIHVKDCGGCTALDWSIHCGNVCATKMLRAAGMT